MKTENIIGQKVKKKSAKPFKSGLRYNTVKEIVNHPVFKDRLAYTFQEDDSIVECKACRRV